MIQINAFRLFAEKLNIITTSAKDVVDQLPLTPIKPGEPRPPYSGLWNRSLRIEYNASVYSCSYSSFSFVFLACIQEKKKLLNWCQTQWLLLHLTLSPLQLLISQLPILPRLMHLLIHPPPIVDFHILLNLKP